MTEKQITEEDVIEASTAYMFTRGSEHTKMRVAIELLISRGWRRREDVIAECCKRMDGADNSLWRKRERLIEYVAALKETP